MEAALRSCICCLPDTLAGGWGGVNYRAMALPQLCHHWRGGR